MTDLKHYTDSSSNKHWFNDEGKRHRLGGPAIEWSNGDRSWYIHGKRHRLDGPAYMWFGRPHEWWVDGECLTQRQFEQHPLVIFYRLCKEVL